MDILKELLSRVESLWPTTVTVILVTAVILIARLIINRRSSGKAGRAFRRQIVTLLLSLVGVLAVIIVLPVKDTLQGQLLGLIGILLSAAIALSSTTFVGNVMAGMMLRAIRSFRPGDFIHVGNYFGRATEQGLLHVEIQTEESDLITMPNLYLVTNPVKVIRATGTIIYAEVSLGYDTPHARIEKLLLEAASEAGLADPFVLIRDLGDFSVTYRVAGITDEVKHLITARSRLREKMLDCLHRGGVEIVSPTFMNTRALGIDRRIIPATAGMATTTAQDEPRPALEDLVFDKAEEAASLEKLRELVEAAATEIDRIKGLAAESADEVAKERFKAEIERLQTRRERIKKLIKERESS